MEFNNYHPLAVDKQFGNNEIQESNLSCEVFAGEIRKVVGTLQVKACTPAATCMSATVRNGYLSRYGLNGKTNFIISSSISLSEKFNRFCRSCTILYPVYDCGLWLILFCIFLSIKKRELLVPCTIETYFHSMQIENGSCSAPSLAELCWLHYIKSLPYDWIYNLEWRFFLFLNCLKV